MSCRQYLFILCAAVTLSLGWEARSQEYVPDSNTVALYHFNETSGDTAHDASGNGNNGVAAGTTIVDGKFGKARQITSSDFVQVNHHPSLDFSTSKTFTVEFWLYASDTVQSLVGKWGGGLDEDDEWNFDLPSGGKIAFSVNSSTSLGSLNTVLWSKPIPFHTWIHVAGTWDGNTSTQELYINGILDTSTTNAVTTMPSINTRPLRFGNIDGLHNSEDLMIDEVRISKVARQPWEFNVPERDSLVAWYPFTDGSTADSSGNGNHGTVHGASLTFDRFGNTNGAYGFDGVSSYVQAQSLSLPGDFTIEAWVNLSSLPSDRRIAVGEGWLCLDSYVGIKDSKLTGWVANTTCIVPYLQSNITSLVGRWHQMVLTYQGDLLSFYVDAVHQADTNYTRSIATSAYPFFIGRSHTGEYFPGAIDDIRIYKRALSETEIDSLYHEGGYELPSAITGNVFHDIDGNGIRDGGDTALAGWKIILKNSSEVPIDSQLTNPAGQYKFDSLSIGIYIVAEAQDTNWIQTYPPGLGTYTQTLSQGSSSTGKDFGNTIGYRYTGPSGNWSDSANWTGGHPPQPNNPAIIPSGVNVTVDSLPSDSILALRVTQGGTLQFTPQVGRLRVSHSVQIDPGAALTLPLTSDTTGVVCYKDWVNRGTVDPGHSIITFAGNKPKVIATDKSFNPFYKLEIAGDSTRTEGNVQVWNRLLLRKAIELRDEDSIFVENNDTSAIADIGKIIRGTVRRQIRAGETGKYRFESPFSFVQFSGSGSYPTSVTMTCIPDTVHPSFQSPWMVGGGTVDTLGNLIAIDSIPIYTRWVFGIPRPRRWLKGTASSDSVQYGEPVVQRLYAISTEGAGSDTLLARRLQLRYDRGEVPPDSDEAKLVLLHGPLPCDSAEKGWNIVSVPLVPIDARKSVLFPGATSRAFRYEGTYEAEDTLEFGTGYWLKFPSKQLVVAPGFDRHINTVSVLPGWNLIGSISDPIATSSITSEPPGLVTSQFYGYKKKYTTADTIFPCRGYWVKVRDAGLLNLSSVGYSFASVLERIHIQPTNELPPAPPEEETVSPAMPLQYALEQNYPNPFNPTTDVRYAICDVSHVSLKVYDVLGREVKLLVDEVEQPGEYTVRWNAGGFASGVYFYRLQAGTFNQTRKLILIR